MNSIVDLDTIAKIGNDKATYLALKQRLLEAIYEDSYIDELDEVLKALDLLARLVESL